MPKVKPKSYGDMTLDDVRKLVKEVREEGLKIQSHYKRLEQEYSDWEDRVYELDKILSRAEEDTGISKEEIYREPTELDDVDLSSLEEDTIMIDKEESILG